ncbi:MAG TPA: 50S ribosomal protein L25 [Candidatus Hydrogenedentes bacterium]|nr:50S ribosomal protein L25 [Candidatus Hydrogenedentota bacterium]HOC71164.1 50S ribosomal protein L25 [Candidatus Hydrogenedentota bacterium]HQL93449.1 50S ribosomal protein L25 [Candidatus Hydrogenedentota bacterium]
MELKTLSVSSRTTGTKGMAHAVRRAGGVPGVLYGGGKETVALEVDGKEFDRLLHSAAGTHPIVSLVCEDQPAVNTAAIVKSVQRHPLKYNPIHVDLVRIRLDETIRTTVPVELTGRCKGVAEGGLLEHQIREIEIECLATQVPEMVTLDITELKIGAAYHVAMLEVPAGVTVLTDSELPVASVHMPRISASEAAAAAAAEGESAPEEAKEKAEEGK